MITPNQSGFQPGDSTINQLLCITHSIHTAFEEVRHEGLIFKSKSNGISLPLLVLTDFYLPNRKQCLV